MQRLLSAGEFAFTHHQANLLPTSTKPKPEMRIKRALTFAILLATLASTYYFYTLHFKPRFGNDELAQNDAAFHRENIVFHVRAKDKDSHKDSVPPAFQLHAEGPKKDEKDKRPQQKFQLFPKGVDDKANPLQHGGEEVDKELEPGNEHVDHFLGPPTSPPIFGHIEDNEGHEGEGDLGVESPGYDKDLDESKLRTESGGFNKDNAIKDDAARQEWSNRMQQQQKLIEKQAQMLQQLQEQFQAQQQQQQQFQAQPQQLPTQQPRQTQQQNSNLDQPEDIGQHLSSAHSTQPSFEHHQLQGVNEGQPQEQVVDQQEASSQDEQQSQGNGLQQQGDSQNQPTDQPEFQAQSMHTEGPNTVQTTALGHNEEQNVNPATANVPPPPDIARDEAGNGKSLLDRVENFDGEIKGRFNGLIFKNDNAPVQLAVNGIQPRRKASPNRQDGVFNQDQPVHHQEHSADAAQMFEQARQKGKMLSGGQLSPESRTLLSQRGRLTTVAQQTKTLKDAEKMFQEVSQRNRERLNKLGEPPRSKPISSDRNGNVQQSQQHPADNSDQRLAEMGIKVHKELIPVDEPSSDAGGAQVGLPKGVGENANIAGGNLENQVEQKIHNDPLLEDRFKQMKNDFEGDIKPGVEPQIELKPGSQGKGNQTEGHHDDSNDGAAPNKKPPSGNLVVTVYDLTQPVEGTFQCVALRLRVFSRTICVYPQHTDTGASKQIIQRGTWEEQELEEFEAALSTDQSLGAVDLGAGLGVYTLAAASKGRPVVAVEPLKDNVRLFHKTMQLNTVIDKVTLITDALGEKVGAGRLRYPSPSGDMGAVYVDPVKLSDVGPGVTDLVRIVTLDDVIPVMTFTRAVVKLDVQGDASKVLKGARRFFSQIDVRYFFMHWLPSQDKLQYKLTESFLRQYGMEPAKSVKGNALYTDVELMDDINFIVWRKIGHAGP